MAIKQPTIYTTGQAAKLCAVSIRTVARWIEMNHLKAFRLPGEGAEYRIMKKNLLKFMNTFGLPTDHIEEDTGYRILLIEKDEQERSSIRELLKEMPLDYTLYEFGDMVEGLINIGIIKPNLIIYNYDLNKEYSARLYDYVKSDLKSTRTLLLTSSKSKDMADMNVTGVSFVLRKPIVPIELVKKSARLLKRIKLK